MSASDAWAALKASTEVDYAMLHAAQPKPVPLGVPPLDSELGGGIPVGTFTVLAGEGGAGKSAMAVNAMYYAALAERHPVFYSLEMPAHMVISRLLSVHTTRIRSIQLGRGTTGDQLMRQVYWSTTRNVVERIAGRDIEDDADAARYVSDNLTRDPVLVAWDHFERYMWPRMAVIEDVPNVDWICDSVRSLVSEGVRPMPIIDYVQLGATGDGTEYELVTRASHALQQLVKECRIPMLVLSSLRNINRSERDEAPTLGMLRGSGHLGYDAGTVIVLKRAGERDGSEQPVIAYVIKNRVGPSGIEVPLTFNGGMNQFK